MSIQLSYIEELEGLRCAVKQMHSEITRLKQGGCRFDCRAQRRADFAAGWTAMMCGPVQELEEAWEEYRRNN